MVLPPSLVDSSESISDIDTDTDIDIDTDWNRNSLVLARLIEWARPTIGLPYTLHYGIWRKLRVRGKLFVLGFCLALMYGRHWLVRITIAWLPIALRTNCVLVNLRERLARQMPKSRPLSFARLPQECMCLAAGENRFKFIKCCSTQSLLSRYVRFGTTNMCYDKANCV